MKMNGIILFKYVVVFAAFIAVLTYFRHVVNSRQKEPIWRGCEEIGSFYLKLFVYFQKALENINSRLALVMKSGKYVIGNKQSLRMLRRGDACLVIIANNTPPLK